MSVLKMVMVRNATLLVMYISTKCHQILYFLLNTTLSEELHFTSVWPSPCTAAGSLRFDLRSLAHPFCQATVLSVSLSALSRNINRNQILIAA